MLNCKEEIIRFIGITTEGCDREFGVTCNGTGEPCQKTISSCKDICNYNCINKTDYFRQCETDGKLFPIDALPNIEKITCKSPKTSLSDGLFVGGSLSITFIDHAHSGIGFDPHYNHPDRTGGGPLGFDCSIEGNSFWKRWIEANENVHGRVIQFFSGPPNGTFPQEYDSTNWYIQNGFSGPDDNCKTSVSAKDLISTIDLSGKYPPENKSVVAGTIPLNLSSGLIFLSGEQIEPLAHLNQSATEIVVKVDEEMIRVEHSSTSSLFDTYTILERGYAGTAIEQHEKGAKVQHVAELTGQKFGEALFSIVRNLIGSSSEVCLCGPQEFLCVDRHSFFTDGDKDCGSKSLQYFKERAFIIKPISMKSILSKFFNETMIFLYQSRLDGCLAIKKFQPPCEEILCIDASCFNSSQTTKKVIPKSKINAVFHYSQPTDICKSVSKDNASQIKVYPCPGYGKGPCNNPYYMPDNELEIFSDWMYGKNEHLANNFAGRWKYIRRKDRHTIPIKFPVIGNENLVEQMDYGTLFVVKNDTCVDENEIYFMSEGKVDDNGEYFVMTAESTNLSTQTNWFHCELRRAFHAGECLDIPEYNDCDPTTNCLEFW